MLSLLPALFISIRREEEGGGRGGRWALACAAHVYVCVFSWLSAFRNGCTIAFPRPFNASEELIKYSPHNPARLIRKLHPTHWRRCAASATSSSPAKPESSEPCLTATMGLWALSQNGSLSCCLYLSLSLSNHIHTFIMGLDLVVDLENDFLRKLGWERKRVQLFCHPEEFAQDGFYFA